MNCFNFYSSQIGLLCISLGFLHRERERENMGKWITKMIFFLMAFLVLSSGVAVKAKATKTSLEVDRKLELLNKPGVKTIKVFFSFLTFHHPFNYILGCVWQRSGPDRTQKLKKFFLKSTPTFLFFTLH